MHIRRRRFGVGLAAVALLGLAAAGTATSSMASVKSATTVSYFQIVNHDGKCLDAEGGSATGRVQQWGCNGNLWQYWAVLTSGHFSGLLIKNMWTGQCLADSGNSPGSAVVQRTCNSSSIAQNWYAEHTTGNWDQYESAQNTGGCNVTAEEACDMHPSGGSSQDGKGIYAQFPNDQSYLWELGAQF